MNDNTSWDVAQECAYDDRQLYQNCLQQKQVHCIKQL